MTINKNNIFQEASIGAIAGFVGQYIGDLIYSLIENKGYSIEIRSEESLYIAGIVSGSISNIYGEKFDLLSSVALSVGIFYMIYDVSDQILGGDGMRNRNYLKDYLIDVFIIYILVLFQNIFLELFFPRRSNEENTFFDDEVITILITNVIINTYYDIKKLIGNNNLQKRRNMV